MTQNTVRLIMVGTDPETRGGIAAVVSAYRASGLFERWAIDYVATHCDGSAVEKALRAARALFKLLGLRVRHRQALLHVHSASRASFWRKSLFMALALLFRWPVIFHLHGGGFERFYEDECSPRGRALVRFFLDRAAAIVVVSERWNRWMRKTTANPRVITIANPVALPAPGLTRRSRSLIAFVGRCEASKGVVDVLEAVAALNPKVPNVRLECAGEGDLEALSRHAHALDIGNRVTWRGWLTGPKKDELLARAAIFVLPSYAEGLPVSLLEAMAAGVAVVASRVGGVPDLIAHGVNGLLVEPGDRAALERALRALLANPELAARLGRAARATIANRFRAELALEPLEALYTRLGVGPRRAASRLNAASTGVSARERKLQEI
ncbi:MAG TPA: glycosyltransferase family 4 protein [Usitatibacter sp.]|nr:glycosyltransferase family 4 protein [Usitatibacter sp.]